MYATGSASLVALLLVASVAQEQAPAPEPAHVAHLQLSKNSKGGLVGPLRRVGIQSIDDEATGGGFHPVTWEGSFPLPPGKHSIEFFAQWSGNVGCATRWFVAEPDKFYRVESKVDFSSFTVRIVDVASGEPVGGKAGSDDEPPPYGKPVSLDDRGCKVLTD